MIRGSDLIQQWRDASWKDHRANVTVNAGLFVSWLIVMGIAAEFTHKYWDKSVWGLIGFLVFWYAVFMVLIWALVKNGNAIRKKRMQNEQSRSNQKLPRPERAG